MSIQGIIFDHIEVAGIHSGNATILSASATVKGWGDEKKKTPFHVYCLQDIHSS